MRVASRFAKQDTDVPPDFQGDPEVHGIDEPRGGGFSIMQNLQKDLVEEEEERGELPAEGAKSKGASLIASAVRQAMYWGGKVRQYRLTKNEQNGGDVHCPRCKGTMGKERFTQKERMYRCPECGFMIPTSKVVTKRIEIEIEPDGGVDVDVTEASCRRS